jgi:hypothetical protein
MHLLGALELDEERRRMSGEAPVAAAFEGTDAAALLAELVFAGRDVTFGADELFQQAIAVHGVNLGPA